MDSELDRLAEAMDRFAAFLRDVGETKWSDWVSSDAERVRSGDYDGVDHFLSAFGGMGSINDLAFMASASDDREANFRSRDDVAEPAYALAKEIHRRRSAARDRLSKSRVRLIGGTSLALRPDHSRPAWSYIRWHAEQDLT